MKTPSITTLIALFWGLTALDILLTAGRFLMRWRMLKRIRIDDIFNGLALLFLLVFMATWQQYVPAQYHEQEYAAGVREDPPLHYNPIAVLKIDSANLIVYWCTIYAVKASFLALYWEIFEVSKRFRIAWSALAIYIGLSFAVSFLSFFWHCGSPATLINESACTRWKHRAITIMYIGVILHIIGDLLLMALPMMMLRTLKMRTREKIGLGMIFALVLVDVAFAILRVLFTVKFVHTKFPIRNTLWSSLDPIIAVMVCALPCYRCLLSPDRTKPIIRTPNLSFDSSAFTSISKSSSPNGNEDASTYVRMDDLGTSRRPINGVAGE